nr:hypothetical protein [uncultured Microbacterium sp.]
MNASDTQNTDTTPSRPFGFWIKAVDRLMAAEFVSAFEGESASRREWRVLNIIDGTMPAHRPLHPQKMRGLVERGWVVADGDGWTLTDEGRAAKDRLGGIVDGIRAKVGDAVSPEDLATTMASLEQIARAFGWDEETPLPRGDRRGTGRRGGFGAHGFGPRHGHPFGRRRGFGPAFGEHHHHGADGEHHHGDDTDPGEHRHGHRGDHGCDHAGIRREGDHSEHRGHARHGDHRPARAAQHAFERGFDAGFSRGRDA